MTTPNSAAPAAGAPAAGAAAGNTPAAGKPAESTAGAQTAQAGAAGDQIIAGETSLLGGEEKPGGKPGEGGDGKGEEPKATGAPENYTDFTVPDGFVLDKAALETFTPLAKEMNLTQEQAQKLVDWDIARTKAGNDAAVKEWNDLVAGWQKAAKTDKEIGGQSFDANLGIANGVINKFGTPELKAMLKDTMVGNHAELIRFMVRVGKALGEGTINTGNSAGGVEKTFEQAVFPTMHK